MANGPLRLDEHAGTVRDVRIGQLRTDVARHFRGVPRKSSTSSVAALGNCGAPQLGGVWIPKHFRPQFRYFGGDPIAQISLQPPKNHAPPATPLDRV
ncbi:MAG: hypothetical protein JWP53_2735 [Conexibacter sp.]|nr:hypothetical protein [Conexibacter sp.]